MAVLRKETASAERGGDEPTGTEPLVAPFDVITYAGPITMAGYERLSHLLETGKTHAKALVVLETPGGDPHAAFRIARAIGFHYDDFHALVPRCCKSAGTLIVVGAAVLHMDDRAELGPLDMQVPRMDAINQRSSALEYSGVLDTLAPHQLETFAETLQEVAEEGASAEMALETATKLVNGLFRPILEQVNPYLLVQMQRALEIGLAYGERLAATGRNIGVEGVHRLASGYPSHAFVIDRREARRLFFDVRAPAEAVQIVATFCRPWIQEAGLLESPVIAVHPFLLGPKEAPHESERSTPQDSSEQHAESAGSPAKASRRPVRPGPKADEGTAGSGGAASAAEDPQPAAPDVH